MAAATDESATIERTLTMVREAHVYSLPPRPSAGGWRCQDWPKSSHIFSGRVRVVAAGDACTVLLEDSTNGSLFAQCPVDNDQPDLSVEPVADSSRYFVLKVQDGAKHAFVGMGFVERNDAFDFNVTLQDHVKHVRFEREHTEEAVEAAAAAPAHDFTLKGSVNIALNTGRTSKQRERTEPRESKSCAGGGLLLPPPPPGGGSSRSRRQPPAAAPPPSAGAAGTLAAARQLEQPPAATDAFGASSTFGDTTFGDTTFGDTTFGDTAFGDDAFSSAAMSASLAAVAEPAAAPASAPAAAAPSAVEGGEAKLATEQTPNPFGGDDAWAAQF